MKKMILPLGSLAVLLILILLLANGSFYAPGYLEPWNGNYHKKTNDVRLQVLSVALLAPSAHNTQPWKIVPDKKDPLRFRLYADTNRLLAATDPQSRQIMISEGTFLGAAEIAANEFGYKTKIEYFPDGEIDRAGSLNSIAGRPIAEVRLTEKEARPDPLFPFLFARSTARTPYLDKPLTEEQKDRIVERNSYDNLRVMIFENTNDLEKIRSFALKGLDIESRLDSTMKETKVIMRTDEYSKNRYRDGLTLAGQGISGLPLFFLQAFSTLFPTDLRTDGDFWRKAESERIRRTPAYLMIVSEDNTRTTQVKTGMLYIRLQLEAAKLGLAMQPNMQALEEYPEMQEVFEAVHREFAAKKRTIQMLVRIGIPDRKVTHSPRRDVMDLIRDR